MTFDHRHYVPILHAKLGEFGALVEADDHVLEGLTPLLQVPPVDIDPDTDEPKRTLDQHLAPLAGRVLDYWGSTRRLFVDLPEVALGESMSDGQHPVEAVFQACRDRGVQAVPVTAPSRDHEYQAAVRGVVRTDGRGCMLRLGQNDLEAIEGEGLQELLDETSVDASGVDLMVDLGWVPSQSLGTVRIAVATVLRDLPYLERWRTLTLGLTTFPDTLTDVSTRGTGTIARDDWDVWSSLASEQRVPRLPAFADYAVAGAAIDPGLDFRIIDMVANIRYTAEREWVIFRGAGVKANGYEQYRSLCRLVIDHPHWRGPGYSWGDRYIAECAAGTEGTGNMTTWRKVATSHHLQTVNEQISTLDGP